MCLYMSIAVSMRKCIDLVHSQQTVMVGDVYIPCAYVSMARAFICTKMCMDICTYRKMERDTMSRRALIVSRST